MNHPLQRVRAGQPFAPSATAWNAFCDVAERHQRTGLRLGGQGIDNPKPAGVIDIRNDSGEELEIFDISGIDGFAITETGNPDGYRFDPLFKGVAPTFPEHSGRFVVLQEPLQDGKIGRAMIHGYTPCRVLSSDTRLEFADVSHGHTDKLAAAGFGAAHILYAPAEAGLNLCYIRLGGPTGRIVRGKTTDLLPISATGTIQVYADGSPVEGFTISATNLFADLADEADVFAAHVDGGWKILSGPGGGGSSIRKGKTTTNHSKGATETVQIWTGEPGEEEESEETVEAYNRFSYVAEGKWVFVVEVDGFHELIAREC